MTTTTERSVPLPTDGPILTPVLGAQWALTLSHAGFVALFGVLLVFLSYLPLRHTDLWGHVVYGESILATGSLPTVDPLLPLAEGMRIVDTMWLSQVILAGVERLGGSAGLSNLFALTVWTTYLLLAGTFYRQSGRGSLAVAGTMLALAVGWSRISTIRPEIFSLLMFSVLLSLVTHRSADGQGGSPTAAGPSRLLWWSTFPLFVVWANLHGTFVCGVALLGTLAVGRALDVLGTTRSLRSVLADRAFRGWTWLTELAIVATLVNPYGLDLWIEVVRFGSNPIVRDISEWNPLIVLGPAGRGFALGCLVLGFVLRHSRRRVEPFEVVILGLFGYLAVAQIRMVGWFAPLLAWIVVPHVAEIVARRWPATSTSTFTPSYEGELPPGRSFRYTLLCALLVWISFAVTPLAEPLLGGKPRSEASLHGEAPRKLVEYLRAHPPTGQIYNPQWWGDWLGHMGPPGLQLFATTNVHLMPRQAWLDYRRITQADGGWEAALDRYRVETLIVDKQEQTQLASAVMRLNGWTLRYEDDQSLVLTRGAAPAPGTSAAAAPKHESKHLNFSDGNGSIPQGNTR